MKRLTPLAVLACLGLAAPAAAQDAHWVVRLGDLALEAPLPDYDPNEWRAWRRRESLRPYVTIEGEGEAYFASTETNAWAALSELVTTGRVAVRATAARDVRGTLFVPSGDWEEMTRRAFTLPAGEATAEATGFLRAKAEHYRVLLDRDVPGAAWFRHRHRLARRALGEEGEALPLPQRWRPDTGETELERSLALLTGGRAVSENLQLDRALPAAGDDGGTVELASLRGVETAEMDWAPLLAGQDPELDRLAERIPGDQHAVFFPSFGALVEVLDELEAYGAPALAAFEPRSQSASTRERYQRQLCLALDELARTFGPLAVRSVAFTGSDPYLRTGSDVALLFEAREAAPVAAFVRARQRAAAEAVPGCEVVHGTLEGDFGSAEYHGALAPGRAVSSYLATSGDVVLVSNSLAQLARLLACRAEESVAAAPEYRFFRSRYARDEGESALLVLTDATIRRWCGPRWRIATSRRVRAAATLAELQAENLHVMAELQPGARPPLAAGEAFPHLGTLRLTEHGVESSVHGSLRFQTPIAEVPLERVTKQEARLYERWRDGYQNVWSRFLDPIAVRFAFDAGTADVDATVIPLILGTDYNELLGLVGNARLDPGDGDPHPETVFHFAMALDPESEQIREAGTFLTNAASRFGAHPMSWLGGSFALWAEASPVWRDLAEAQAAGDFEEDVLLSLNELPLAAVWEVGSGLKLAAFLSALRAFVEETAPGMIEWTTLPHGPEDTGRRYVRLSSRVLTADDVSLYYATLPGALVLSLNEDALKRAMDRLAPAEEAQGEGPPAEPHAWLGESFAVDLEAGALDMFRAMGDDDLVEVMRVRAWSNLPILNEWRRELLGEDPVAAHERLWGERLLCPAGGEYVWDEEWHTFSSTVYGHPGRPQDGPGWPAVVRDLVALRGGVTFEHGGLRARVVLQRGR